MGSFSTAEASRIQAQTKSSSGSRLVLVAVVLLVTWLVLPLLPLALWSIAKRWYFPDLLPQQWSLDAWNYVFSQTSGFSTALWNSLLLAFPVTLIAVLLGIPAGRALACYRFRGKQLVELLVLAPVLVPGIAIVGGLHGIMLDFGLNNSLSGVALAHLIPAMPYMILVMASVYAGFDTRYEEQARTLGAGPLKVFFYVTLPAILPGIVVGAFFTFLVSWSQYILTLVIGGGRVVTLPLLLFNFVSAGRNDVAGALAVMFVIPGLIMIIFVARYLSGRSAIAELPSRL